MSTGGIEDKVDLMELIDKMISCKIFNEPEVETENMEEYYDKYYDLENWSSQTSLIMILSKPY
jgi:hypothetical protein